MVNKQSTLLFSGGPDSLISLFYLNSLGIVPDLLTFDDFQHPATRAASEAAKTLKKLIPSSRWRTDHVLFGDFICRYEKKDFEVPARNFYLALLAANQTNCDRIYIGVQKGEMTVPDRSQPFFEKSSELLTFLLRRPIEIIPTFPNMTKTQMVTWFKRNYPNDFHLLRESMSCYVAELPNDGGLPLHCGECPACVRRAVAFRLNGLDTAWATDPFKTELFAHYKSRGDIDPERKKEFGAIPAHANECFSNHQHQPRGPE